MRKKLFFVLMICAVTAVVAATLAGCSQAKLPSVRNLQVSDDGYLAWGAVDGADGYVLYFNDDETERFYTTDTKVSVDNPDIRSVLKSGTTNCIYIRAVTMGSNNLPDRASDRSKIVFNYSRKLSTPNKIKMSKERFSWRGVIDAEDYKAYVVKEGDTGGKMYDMTWATGTASVTGTINDLPNGYMYYVSIVATASGYENSDPSDSVPFDRTNVSAVGMTYAAGVGDESYALVIDPDDDNVYSVSVTAQKGVKVSVKDNAGAEYPVTGEVDKDGDYVITLNLMDNSATVKAVDSYFVYVNGSATPVKLSYNAATDVYIVNLELSDGDNFIVKDSEGNLLTTFTDDSVTVGSSVTAPTYSVRVQADKAIKVSGGKATDIGGSEPVSMDGKWPVTFDYNYVGAPAATVEYATDGRRVTAPADPIRAGYIFAGWYEDALCFIPAFDSKKSVFNITSPTTLYAKWTREVEEHTHADTDGDGKCDECGTVLTVVCTDHVDVNADGKCDVCGKAMLVVKCTTHVDSDGDGKCDKCGTATKPVEIPVDTTATLYLDINDVSWFRDAGAVINVHIWYTDGTNNGFPGPAMTYDAETGRYAGTYYSSRTVKGIIFTRNNPVAKPAEGEKTEWNRVDLSEVTFDPNYPVYRLFTCTDSGSTGRWIKEDEDVNAEGEGKIYLDFRDVDWMMEAAPVNAIYVWYTDGTENARFPGKTVTYTAHMGVKRYSCYVDYFTDKTVAGVIFTRNDPNKPLGEGVWNTIEFNAASGFVFDATKPAFRVTAWGNAFEGYWESEDAATTISVVEDQQDTEITDESTAYFYLDISSVTWYTSDNAAVIAQIVYADGLVSAVNGVEGTLEDGRFKWSYNGAKEVSAIKVWRLIPTTGETYNEISLTLSADPDKNVIVVSAINDGSPTYHHSTMVADSENPYRTVTVDVSAIGWFHNDGASAYLYMWYVGGTENATFPGERMTETAEGSGIYTLEIDTRKELEGVIVARSLDGVNAVNQTKNLVMPGDYYIVVTDLQ